MEKIEKSKLIHVVRNRIPKRKFYCQNSFESWTAVDNTTGEAWAEDFKTEGECINWLNK